MTPLLRWIVSLLGGFALFLVCLAAVLRHVAPEFSADWSDEVSVICLIWAMLLTGWQTTRRRHHIAFGLVRRARSPRLSSILAWFADLTLVCFALLAVASGALVVRDSWLIGEHTESTAQIGTWVYYASLPVSLGLVAFAALLSWGKPADGESRES